MCMQIIHLEVELLLCRVCTSLALLEIASDCIYLCYWYYSSPCSTSLPGFFNFFFFLPLPVGVKWYLIEVLIYIFFIVNEISNFSYAFGHCASSVNCQLMYRAHFFNWIVLSFADLLGFFGF